MDDIQVNISVLSPEISSHKGYFEAVASYGTGEVFVGLARSLEGAAAFALDEVSKALKKKAKPLYE